MLEPRGKDKELHLSLEGRHPASLSGRLESRGRRDESEEESKEAGPVVAQKSE